jgi:hypothetical protein
MSLLVKGITRLSELVIDADKDWNTKGITSLKQVAAAMSKGDIVVRDAALLVRMAAGPDGYVLTSAGPGKMPAWAPAGGALKYYFPVIIGITHETAVKQLARSIQVALDSFATWNRGGTDDAPADYRKLLTPGLARVLNTDSLGAPGHATNINALMGRDIYILCDGAVSETSGGVQTDETTAARSGAGNDMNLPPMTPALGDKYYIGSNYPFRGVWLNIGIAGAGNWSVLWYYWNGSGWAVCPGEDDQTSSFMQSGMRRVNWSLPGDWATKTIQSMTLFWAKAEVTYYNNQSARPYGTQAWVIIK